MASTSHALLNFPYGSFDFPNVFICGAFVQVRWLLKNDVFKFIFAMEVSDCERPVLLLGINLL